MNNTASTQHSAWHMGVPSKWEPQQSSQVAEEEVLGSQLGGGGGSEWPERGVNRGCETWMGPCAAAILPSTVL